MSRSPVPSCSKTACRMEVLGKVSSLAFDAQTHSCLASTVINGAHVFHMDDNFYGSNLSAGMAASRVESYPYNTFGNDPLLCGCFVGGGQMVCLGSASGSLTTVSRRSRGITSSFVVSSPNAAGVAGGDDAADDFYLPIRSIEAMPDASGAVVACTQQTTAIVDMERSIAVFELLTPVPRAVGAVALTAATFAVANYDGKVLLYDTRESLKPSVVLSVPDQITCLTRCADTAQVCVGTVAGRVFTLRCTESAAREQAFGTGRKRSPIRAIAMYRNHIVTGDISGKLSILDASDVPNCTRYWTAEVLLHTGGDLTEADGARESGGEPGSRAAVAQSWRQAEVTSVALAKGIAWAAFSAPDAVTTQVVALPA